MTADEILANTGIVLAAARRRPNPTARRQTALALRRRDVPPERLT
jgi:hypothetical protein